MKAKEFVKTLTGNAEKDALALCTQFEIETERMIEGRTNKDGSLIMRALQTVVQDMKVWAEAVSRMSSIVIDRGITQRAIHDCFEKYRTCDAMLTVDRTRTHRVGMDMAAVGSIDRCVIVGRQGDEITHLLMADAMQRVVKG